MTDRYILNDNGDPEPCEDLMTWAAWLEADDRRRLASDYIGDTHVSTVFLGLDHRFGGHGAPILWETMIFNGPEPLNEYQVRYSSREAALAGHAKALEHAQAVLGAKNQSPTAQDTFNRAVDQYGPLLRKLGDGPQ